MANNKQKAKVTPAEIWREIREEGYLIRLPSGHTARLRPVSVVEMLKHGHIPDTLTPIAAEAFADKLPSRETTIENAKSVIEFLEIVTVASFIEPRVVITEKYDDVPPEGCISIYDVSVEDQFYVLALSGAPTRALEPFRSEHNGDVEPEPGGDGVPQETK